MGFNSGFKGLMLRLHVHCLPCYFFRVYLSIKRSTVHGPVKTARLIQQ